MHAGRPGRGRMVGRGEWDRVWAGCGTKPETTKGRCRVQFLRQLDKEAFPATLRPCYCGVSIGECQVPDEHPASLDQKMLQFRLGAMPQHLLNDLLGEEDGQPAAACRVEQPGSGAHWLTT